MKVSIIVPFNRGLSYLRDCLDSIRAQQAEDIEVIIVGDSPSEDVEGIQGEYKDSLPITYILSPAPGVAAARNAGLREAKGNGVFFLDSDDYLLEGCINILIEAAEHSRGKLIAGRIEKTWYKRESYLFEKRNAEKAAGVITSEGIKSGRISEIVSNEGISEDVKGETTTEKTGSESDIEGLDSVLNVLIPKALIDRTAIAFNETYLYYSDLPFITRLISENGIIYCEDALYIKRSHNDAIRMPSLTQIHDNNKPDEFINSYTEAYTCSAGGNRAYLEHYICGQIVTKLCRGKHPEGLKWSEQTLAKYGKLIEQTDIKTADDFSRREKKVLKHMAGGKYRLALRTARFAVFMRHKKGPIGSLLQWKWAVYKHIFRRLSVKKNYCLFESFLGKSYGDSCKYIYQYMLQEHRNSYKYIWVIDDKQAEIPGKPVRVKTLSLRYFYYVARSGLWINNMRQPVWFDKRPGMRFLETWHGTPLKKLVFDMEDVHSASPEYKMNFYKQSRVWDYLISDNHFSTEAFKSAFLFPEEKILELGYPRNDILYAPDREERAAAVKQILGIPRGKKVVLYAPTWRDDEFYGPGQYRFELPLDLEMMKELRDEYVFVLRTHYFIADHLNIKDEDKDFVIDASRYNDIGELYLIADVCITDYSSVFFDYANLKRPLLFFVYDFEKYRDVLRGFYIDMETELPGPLLYTNEEVLRSIRQIDKIKAEYTDRYDAFYKRFCSLDDGRAAERIVKRLMEE